MFRLLAALAAVLALTGIATPTLAGSAVPKNAFVYPKDAVYPAAGHGIVVAIHQGECLPVVTPQGETPCAKYPKYHFSGLPSYDMLGDYMHFVLVGTGGIVDHLDLKLLEAPTPIDVVDPVCAVAFFSDFRGDSRVSPNCYGQTFATYVKKVTWAASNGDIGVCIATAYNDPCDGNTSDNNALIADMQKRNIRVVHRAERLKALGLDDKD